MVTNFCPKQPISMWVITGTLMFQANFEVFYLFLVEELMTIEDPSLSAYGYQLLPLATSYLMDYNRDFDNSDIF